MGTQRNCHLGLLAEKIMTLYCITATKIWGVLVNEVCTPNQHNYNMKPNALNHMELNKSISINKKDYNFKSDI